MKIECAIIGCDYLGSWGECDKGHEKDLVLMDVLWQGESLEQANKVFDGHISPKCDTTRIFKIEEVKQLGAESHSQSSRRRLENG